MSVNRKVTVPLGRSGVVAITLSLSAGRTGPGESYPGRSSASRDQVRIAVNGADRAADLPVLT